MPVKKLPRVVVDTNVLVSALIGRRLRPFIGALKTNRLQLIFSKETFDELLEVLQRPHLARYFTQSDAKELVNLLNARMDLVNISTHVNDCRDAKDNIFLDCALSGSVDYVVTGDPDLLELNPYKGIPIISPLIFLSSVLNIK